MEYNELRTNEDYQKWRKGIIVEELSGLVTSHPGLRLAAANLDKRLFPASYGIGASESSIPPQDN